jgi:hypothetical protein
MLCPQYWCWLLTELDNLGPVASRLVKRRLKPLTSP